MQRDGKGRAIAADGLSVAQDFQARAAGDVRGGEPARGEGRRVDEPARRPACATRTGGYALNAPQLTVERTLYLTSIARDYVPGDGLLHSPVRAGGDARRAGSGRSASSAGAGCGWTTAGSATPSTSTARGSCSPTSRSCPCAGSRPPSSASSASGPSAGGWWCPGPRWSSWSTPSDELAGPGRAVHGRLRLREPRAPRPLPAVPPAGVGGGGDPRVLAGAVRAAGRRAADQRRGRGRPRGAAGQAAPAPDHAAAGGQGCGATSRTGRWSTGTGRAGPRCGWRCCGRRARCSSPSSTHRRSRRTSTRSGTPPCTRWICCCRSSISARTGQWQLEGGWQWGAAGLVLLGWILATTVAAGRLAAAEAGVTGAGDAVMPNKSSECSNLSLPVLDRSAGQLRPRSCHSSLWRRHRPAVFQWSDTMALAARAASAPRGWSGTALAPRRRTARRPDADGRCSTRPTSGSAPRWWRPRSGEYRARGEAARDHPGRPPMGEPRPLRAAARRLRPHARRVADGPGCAAARATRTRCSSRPSWRVAQRLGVTGARRAAARGRAR